jgi:tetratricopeptide (TPR) repeat protein
LAEGVEEPTVLNLAASAHYNEGRFDHAVHLLTRARSLAPDDPNILNSLGICLKALGQTAGALEAFDDALRIDPRMAPAHFNRGEAFDDLNDVAASRSAYLQAISLEPDYIEALASLAWIEAQAGDAASARTLGERALALSPRDALARMALASAALQQGDLPGAAAHLMPLSRDPELTTINRSIALGLTGDLLDAEGRPAHAFEMYQASNAQLHALYAHRFAAGEPALARANRLISWCETADREEWRATEAPVSSAETPKSHIFLVGFPRSGTTLLENILASHPEVISLEEKDCLGPSSETYLASDEGLGRLSRINSEESARERGAYWDKVRSYGVDPRGTVFIDKLPLASLQLPLIAKLFPDARVLFAVRDPRDVVLSCFRRRFAMNSAMFELLTLRGAAVYYDAVMRLSGLYRALLPLPEHIVRYEDLLEDFEGTARVVCDFLGLEWDQALFDFAAKARTRGIGTPSAAQVVRGLNRDGQGVWRRYREQMAPVQPILEPWVERLGYTSE